MNTHQNEDTKMYNSTNLQSSDLVEELSDIQLETVIGGQGSGSLIVVNNSISPAISVSMLDSGDGSQSGFLSSQSSAHQNGSS